METFAEEFFAAQDENDINDQYQFACDEYAALKHGPDKEATERALERLQQARLALKHHQLKN